MVEPDEGPRASEGRLDWLYCAGEWSSDACEDGIPEDSSGVYSESLLRVGCMLSTFAWRIVL